LPIQATIRLITSQTFDAVKSGDPQTGTLCEDQTSVELQIFWHAIHYLLTGDTTHTFLQSGVQLDEVSGHCEFHSPRDVATLHARLPETSVSELMSRFDLVTFDQLGIYGGRWATPTDVSEPYTFQVAEELKKWSRAQIEEVLVRFIAFVRHAAENGFGLVVLIL
jgi:Domain of unknown function (DUF1877)